MRLLAACLAALQIALPGAISVADARGEAQSLVAATRVHVESQSSTACPRIHALDCALCQFLSSARGEPPAGDPLVAARRDHLGVTHAESDRAASITASLPPSRAPPHLS